MRDYSLHGLKNRLANEGEQLFIHKFHTGSKGQASVADLRPMQKQFGVGPREEVRFVQLAAVSFRYRDAIRFNNGREVILQKLSDGLRMDVLSLALVEETLAPKFAASSSTLEQVSVGQASRRGFISAVVQN
jgi:hypothetical protein